MPLWYPQQASIMDTVLTGRKRCIVFDVSHMARFHVHELESHFKVKTPGSNHCRLGWWVDDNAIVKDDFIVTRLDSHRLHVTGNACRADEYRLLNWLPDPRPVMLAVQGPKSQAILQDALQHHALDNISFMQARLFSPTLQVSRTGYTGEDGFEVITDLVSAHAILNAMQNNPDITWGGLAARDVMRMEAGFALSGVDFGKDVTLDELRRFGLENDTVRNRCLWRCGPRRIPISEAIFRDNKEVGIVTSCTYSPHFEEFLAMGYSYAVANVHLRDGRALIRTDPLPHRHKHVNQ